MKITRFDIRNFKGVSETSINLTDEVPGNVITLIGLNESGKTTVLEALSHFITEDKDTASLVGTVHQKSSLQDIIPKHHKAAFTGVISVTAFIKLDDVDVKGLAAHFLREHALVLDETALPRQFTLERAYNFSDSAHDGTNTYWSIVFPARAKRAKKVTKYAASEKTREIWLSGLGYLRGRIPKIVYFPTFLFNFPDRIYLEGVDDSDVNKYYRQVVQDVLDSQGDGLSVQKHVVDRIKKQREGFPTPATFIAHFLGLDERAQVDAVMQKVSNEMSRVVFNAWGDILGRTVANKRVQVDWFIDAEKKNAPYLQVSIIDGQSRYSLSEDHSDLGGFFRSCYSPSFAEIE